MSGITPPSDPSSQDRSRSSPETQNLIVALNQPRVPAMSTHIERVGRTRGSPAQSSDTSVERPNHNRGRRNRNPPDPGMPSGPIDMSAQQATFLAGVSAHQAHQASVVAEHASNMALHYQHDAQVAQQLAAQQQHRFHQDANALRERAEAYVSQAHLEAEQTVEGYRQEAIASIQASQHDLQNRANQLLGTVRGEIDSRDQHIRDQSDAIQRREHEILRLQRELDAARMREWEAEQRHARQQAQLAEAHQLHMEQVAISESLGLRGPVEIPFPTTPRSSHSAVGGVALVPFETPPIPAPSEPPMPWTPKSNLTVVQGTRTPSGMSFDLFGDIAEQEARAAQAAMHPVGIGVSQPVGLPAALVPPQGLVELPPGLSPVMQPPPQRSHVTPLNHPVQPITNPPGTQASFQEWIRGELQGMVAAQVEVLAQRMQQAGMV